MRRTERLPGSGAVPLVAAATLFAGPPGPAAPPRYTEADLACAAFHERVEIVVTLQARRGIQEHRIRREGVLQFRGRREAGWVRFEAWFDSLALRRQSPSGTLTPDTDGLIGGRWRGRLGAAGGVELDSRPFLPPDIQSVADLSDMPARFFPPLAPVTLRVGERWNDSTGLEVERLPDSAAVPRSLRRFLWRLETRSASDPTSGALGEQVDERGALAWDDSLGPVGWSRRVAVQAHHRPGPPAAGVVRARVDESATVLRIVDVTCS